MATSASPVLGRDASGAGRDVGAGDSDRPCSGTARGEFWRQIRWNHEFVAE